MKGSKKASKFTPTRREPRIPQLRELTVSYEGSSDNIVLRSPDISLHGMFVNTATHFPEGAVVNLRFRLTSSDVEVHIRGEVRYCLDGIGIGVEFMGIEPDAERAIAKEVKVVARTRIPKKVGRSSRSGVRTR